MSILNTLIIKLAHKFSFNILTSHYINSFKWVNTVKKLLILLFSTASTITYANDEINLKCSFLPDSTGYEALHEVVLNKSTSKANVTEVNTEDASRSFSFTADAVFTSDSIMFKRSESSIAYSYTKTWQIDRTDLSVATRFDIGNGSPINNEGKCEIFEVKGRKL